MTNTNNTLIRRTTDTSRSMFNDGIDRPTDHASASEHAFVASAGAGAKSDSQEADYLFLKIAQFTISDRFGSVRSAKTKSKENVWLPANEEKPRKQRLKHNTYTHTHKHKHPQRERQSQLRITRIRRNFTAKFRSICLLHSDHLKYKFGTSILQNMYNRQTNRATSQSATKDGLFRIDVRSTRKHRTTLAPSSTQVARQRQFVAVRIALNGKRV